MKTGQLVREIQITLLGMLLLLTANVQATSSDRQEKAGNGTVVCTGNFRESTSTITRWTIHNVNKKGSINLDRMRVFTAGGNKVYDSSTDGLATSSTVVPFGRIRPYQTISFKSDTLITNGFLPAELPGNQRPVKVIFEWSSNSEKDVITPYVIMTRHSTSTGETRHARDCRAIK